MTGRYLENWRMYEESLFIQSFFGLQIFDGMVRTRLVKTGLVSLMSGHVRMEYSLPKSFGSEHFWDPEYFG